MDKAKEAIVQKTVPVAKKSITAHLGSIQASEQQPYTG